MAYELIFDSCNDLGPSYDKDNGVTIIPLAFEMEGKRYLRYQDDRELSVDQFYKNQSDKIYGKTAQVTPIDFINHSTPFLRKEKMSSFVLSLLDYPELINLLWLQNPN